MSSQWSQDKDPRWVDVAMGLVSEEIQPPYCQQEESRKALSRLTGRKKEADKKVGKFSFVDKAEPLCGRERWAVTLHVRIRTFQSWRNDLNACTCQAFSGTGLQFSRLSPGWMTAQRGHFDAKVVQDLEWHRYLSNYFTEMNLQAGIK